jgi:ribonucleoside-triphosphate reductase (thioredoxin)
MPPPVPVFKAFKLDSRFISKYKKRLPNFGYNGLGDLVYRRTYSRINKSGKKEQWYETVQRVIEGAINMKNRHFEQKSILGNDILDQKIGQKMYDLVWNMKFLPSGRNLWAMGTDLTEKKHLYAALNNCAFVSTKDIAIEYSKPFTFAMDALMLGVGVGFDTRGAKTSKVYRPKDRHKLYVIADTRESWVEATSLLIESYLKPNQNRMIFDYSNIRRAGVPLKTFGGVSSGSEPLIKLHAMLNKILERHVNNTITSTLITDVFNLIGKCVVAGNVRRSSQIALGNSYDEEFVNLKNYDKNPEREAWGWCSNNSVFADDNTNYNLISKMVSQNGEPGVFWLQNARDYGRMIEPPNYKDHKAMGVNPCGEQTLESYELCNLVEVFMNKHTHIDDFLETIRYAFLYGKIVTLSETHWPETNEIINRNRRIGLSLSSISEFYNQNGSSKLIKWFNTGYNEVQTSDNIYSKWFQVPKSIKTTTVKPSGTISILAGATPGVHASVGGKHHIRRIQMSTMDSHLPYIHDAGYQIEDSVTTPNTKVVEFPIKLGNNIKTQENTTIEEQFYLASLAQLWWSDNQVSCTISFKENEQPKIAELLNNYKNSLKSISLIPKFEDKTTYKQMPYETIDEHNYNLMAKKIKPIEWEGLETREIKDSTPEKYCSNDGCSIV